MRFRITLTFNQSATVLFPVDYRFALAAAVYRVMEQGDAEYARWLHDTGYADGSKRFKFFTLSPFRGIHPTNPIFTNRRSNLNSQTVDS